jgi:uncharacterized protein (TIGR02147 family)
VRSFARALEIESSALTKILNGKRAISPKMFDKIGKNLDFTPIQRRLFAESVEEKRGRRIHSKTAMPLPFFEPLEDDVFETIANWYHYAILELIETHGFQPDAKWIAHRLQISVPEVNIAIERLFRLQMIKVDKKGKWLDHSQEVTNIRSGQTTAAKKLLQREIMTLGLRALDEIPFEHRDHTSMTMAIDSSLLNEAREKVKAFRRELCVFLQSGKKKDSVYQLSVALFPATQI